MVKIEKNNMNLWDEIFMQDNLIDLKAKHLYLYLLTNSLINIAGVYEITDRRIKFDLNDFECDLNNLFAQLQVAEKVYRLGHYVIVKDAPLFLKSHSKAITNEIDSIIKLLPSNIINKMKEIGYQWESLYKSKAQKATEQNAYLFLEEPVSTEGSNEEDVKKKV